MIETQTKLKNEVLWSRPDAELTRYDRAEYPVEVRGTDAEKPSQPTRNRRGTSTYFDAEQTRNNDTDRRGIYLFGLYGIGALGFGVIGYGTYLLISAFSAWLYSLPWAVIFRVILYGFGCIVLGFLAWLILIESARNRRFKSGSNCPTQTVPGRKRIIVTQTTIIEE